MPKDLDRATVPVSMLFVLPVLTSFPPRRLATGRAAAPRPRRSFRRRELLFQSMCAERRRSKPASPLVKRGTMSREFSIVSLRWGALSWPRAERRELRPWVTNAPF
ncbi:unnamed protein product [Prorocentrum cordatum]|uniref:Secreted protein n=1 Tax=Prorocentrum cordatum TaxID=2364126 RepID=A0ABN9W9K6_9DINO|nr:unnamed protein product [Polarella glacialis]